MHHPRFIKLRFAILLLLLLLSVASARGQNPVPFVSQPLFPSAMAPGGPSFTLTVNGTNFISTTIPGYTTNSVVYWNGTALTTTFVNSNQLKAVVPAANIASQGTAWITVSNGGVTSNVAYFEITNPLAALSFDNSFYAVGTSTLSTPVSVASGDFNGDGRLDLAVVNNADNTISVLLANGEGTFQPAVNYSTIDSSFGFGHGPLSVAVGDVNRDGKLDLLVGTNDSLSVFYGNGDGTFQPISVLIRTSTECPIYSVALGDFKGRGYLNFAFIYCNSVFIEGTEFNAGNGARSIGVGDFNGDGKLDLAVANSTDGTVSVLLGDGTGNFSPATLSPFWAGSNPYSVAVGDFNGDGKPDLVLVNNVPSGTVTVLLGKGDGSFLPAVQYPVGTNPVSVTVGDFNGDGTLDLAVANYYGSAGVSVLLGNGDGTFQSALGFAADTSPFSIAAGDLNGDGRMDLAVVNSNSGNVSILLQPSPPLPPPPPSSTITDVTAGSGLSGGGTTGDVVLNNTGVLSLTAGNGLSVTGGQTPTLSLNTAVTDARYLQLSGGTLSGSLFAPSFTGSGAGLTSLNPANLIAGLAGINISGNAATASAAGTAATATNALALGGVLPNGYAPASGSPNYIQNGASPAQPASLNITGTANIGGNTSITGNLGTAGTLTIGTVGTPITEHSSILITPTFAAVKSGACASTTFALTGAADGDTIALGVPNERMTTGGGQMLYSAWVSAPGTITLRACNIGAAAEKTAGTGSIRIDLWKH